MLPNSWRYLRGDIYYADMEPRLIGSEQGGKRPVVVLQNNIGNRHSPTLIVATVTTRTEKKKNQPTHVLVGPYLFMMQILKGKVLHCNLHWMAGKGNGTEITWERRRVSRAKLSKTQI